MDEEGSSVPAALLRHLDLIPRNRHLGAANGLLRFGIGDVPGDGGFSVRARPISTGAANESQRRWNRQPHHAGAVRADTKWLGDERDAERVEPVVKYDDVVCAGRQLVDPEPPKRISL